MNLFLFVLLTNLFTCHRYINSSKPQIPKLSIAAGIDFGHPDRFPTSTPHPQNVHRTSGHPNQVRLFSVSCGHPIDGQQGSFLFQSKRVYPMDVFTWTSFFWQKLDILRIYSLRQPIIWTKKERPQDVRELSFYNYKLGRSMDVLWIMCGEKDENFSIS